jgi:hypothetical protein
MFHNRIRLPLYLKTPQFPTEANRFRLSDGTSKTLSVVIRKTWALQTDYMGELTHQKLVIALNHDNVSIEGDKYAGGATVDGDYEISWPDFLDYPLGQAEVKIQVTPFDATNSNCQTCEEANQLSLVDDDIGEIAEGDFATVNAYTNDTICCFPVTAEITWYDPAYIAAASINEITGVVTLTAINPAPSVGSIKLATYRVTCPGGGYDEADIYGSIAGTEPACEPPTFGAEPLTFSDPPAPFTILTGEWIPPGTPPASYEWILTLAGSEVAHGNNTAPEIFGTVTGLLGNTEYVLSVRSVCSEGVYSSYATYTFTTPAGTTEGCGQFAITADDGTVFTEQYDYSYMDCEGVIRNKIIRNLDSINLCLLMDETNTPIYFETTGPVTYSYTQPC